MEYRETPVGKIRIPDDLKHAAYTDQQVFYWGDGGIGIYFWRPDESIDGTLTAGPDGAIGQAVAHIFMTEDQFANFPRIVDALLDMRRESPNEGT